MTFIHICGYNPEVYYHHRDDNMRPVIVSLYPLFIFIAISVAGCASDKPKMLMYDDGKMDDKKPLVDNGHAIKFTVPGGQWGIKAIRFYAVRKGTGEAVGKQMVINICEGEDAGNVLYEARALMNIVDTVTPKWRNIDVNPPLYHPGDIWVIIDTNSTLQDTVFVGVDTSVKNSHSKQGRPGGPLMDLETVYDWMIRVELTKISPDELGNSGSG